MKSASAVCGRAGYCGRTVAKNAIPGALERRHLIEKEQAPPQSLRIAQAYLDAGRVVEALEFLRKADAGEQLAALRAQAVEEGDAFLLRSAAETQGSVPSRDEWRELAQAAAAAGKDCYASEAQRQAERGED